MKKKIIISICIILALVLCIGGIWAAASAADSSKSVEVTSIDQLHNSQYGASFHTTGVITANASQEIHLTDQQKVKEISVKEGDSVKIGDELFTYDMSLINIDLEVKKLDLELIGLKIKSTNIEIDKLKKEKPYSPPALPKDMGLTENAEQEARTQGDINADIDEKKKEIRDLELKLKETELIVETMEKQLQEQSVKSAVNGVIKSVGNPEEGNPQDGSAFMVVTSEEGLYVRGGVNELYLDQFKAGQILNGLSWESRSIFTAEVKEISSYPDDSGMYGYREGFTYYPFIAYIDDPGELKNNEWVELSATLRNEEQPGNYLCIEKMYVREENGRKYVYKANENGKLKKQYVKTGKVIDGWFIEIKQGLTLEDRIAFPYGKNVRNGVKVKDTHMEEKSPESRSNSVEVVN